MDNIKNIILLVITISGSVFGGISYYINIAVIDPLQTEINELREDINKNHEKIEDLSMNVRSLNEKIIHLSIGVNDFKVFKNMWHNVLKVPERDMSQEKNIEFNKIQIDKLEKQIQRCKRR